MISDLVQNLIAVNRIVEGQNMSFEDALSIVRIYDETPEPNDLIDEAEVLATSDIDTLERNAIELGEESDRFLHVSLPTLRAVDFKAIAQSYPRPFYDRFHKAEVELNSYWKVYCQLNNQLDYLDLDSEEYRDAEKLCEEAKAEHEERQKEVRRLYAKYEQANKASNPVFSFNPDYLETIVVKYRDIASAILADIKRIREGS
jgi:hypothetical protein